VVERRLPPGFFERLYQSFTHFPYTFGMDFAFARFERPLARPLGIVPDFPVLLAVLSACQSGTVTARLQMRLDQGRAQPGPSPDRVIMIFADAVGPRSRDRGGSFSPGAARRLALEMTG
jgi:hypothetical protein